MVDRSKSEWPDWTLSSGLRHTSYTAMLADFLEFVGETFEIFGEPITGFALNVWRKLRKSPRGIPRLSTKNESGVEGQGSSAPGTAELGQQ
jgi:hypothetical protein